MHQCRVFFFFARQERRSFFTAASPSSKYVKGSHGGVLVAPRSSWQLGAIVANVDDHKVEWRGRDWVACVVKAVRASYVDIRAFMTSTADARCLENVSKLRQISGLLLKQRREFITAADWNMVLEQLETTFFCVWLGSCVMELPGERGSGRSIDYLVVSENFRHCVRNVCADKGALWLAHVATALDVMRTSMLNVSQKNPRGAVGWRLREASLKRLDDSASEGQGHQSRARVQSRLLKVKRSMERGLCNTGQFRKSVDFLRSCAGELPTIPPTRTQPGFCTTIFGLGGSAALSLSALKKLRAWCLRQGHE